MIRFIVNIAKRTPPDATLDLVQINGMPGLAALLDGVPAMLLAFEFADDRVAAIHSISSPHKLTASRHAWIAAAGGDADNDPRVATPPRLPTGSTRDPWQHGPR